MLARKKIRARRKFMLHVRCKLNAISDVSKVPCQTKQSAITDVSKVPQSAISDVSRVPCQTKQSAMSDVNKVPCQM